MSEQQVKVRRALLSVYDKTGLVELGRGLHELGVELVSSRSTAAALVEAGLPVTDVADVTGVPPILDHRVVTLHPKIHGGLLADPTNATHRSEMQEYGIEPFQLVVSNLYPFLTDPSIELIDIGGPAMVRAAAKNHAHVAIVTSRSQYDALLAELRGHDGAVTAATRRALAIEAFAQTAAYDASILQWLQGDERLPEHLHFALDRTGDALRYGENPHQHAARYRVRGTTSWLDGIVQHSGVALSYLNLYDADAAWRLVHDLAQLGGGPACAIIKHANPCGAALASDLATAYQRALECDERSAFGGIVALSEVADAATVERVVAGPQADVVIAPGYAPGAIDALQREAQEHADHRGAGARCVANRRAPDLGRLSRPGPAPLRRDARHLEGRHRDRADRGAVARSRDCVADLRPRQEQRHRARA